MTLNELLPDLKKGRKASHPTLPKDTTIQFDSRFGDYMRVVTTTKKEGRIITEHHKATHVGPEDIEHFDSTAWTLLPEDA